MAATEMNFGPDWIRTIMYDGKNAPNSINSNMVSNSSTANSSGNGSNSSTNSTTKPTKSTAVKHRYSCEEMLSYYDPNACYIPKELLEHEDVLVKETQKPLLFIEFTPDEISLLSQSINCETVLKKANKEMGDNQSERQLDYRERTSSERGEMPKDMLRNKAINSGGDMARTGGERKYTSNNGTVFQERGNGHPLRPGRGGSLSERASRSTIRQSGGSLFSRLSSYDESTTSRSQSTITSPSLLISKKGGIQRSATDSSGSMTNMFLPNWRTNTTTGTTGGSSTTTTTTTTSASESKSEWRLVGGNRAESGSDSSKNWRSDSTSGNKPQSASISSKKDFFADSEDNGSGGGNSYYENSRDFNQRKRNQANGNGKTSKLFPRRYDLEQNDLFKTTKPGIDSLDSLDVLESERDLFASVGRNSSSYSSYGSSNYGDLFSAGGGTGNANRGGGKTNSNMNRYRHEYGEKWNNNSHHGGGKSYSSGDRENRYSHRQHQSGQQHSQYQRSNSHNNEDEMDKYGGGGSDDDDYRRSSLPEWSLEDPSSIDVTKVGTFDASGAFHEALDEELNNGEKEKRRGSIQKNDDSGKPSEKESMEKNEKRQDQEAHEEKKINYFNDPCISPNYKSQSENSKEETKHPDLKAKFEESENEVVSKRLKTMLNNNNSESSEGIGVRPSEQCVNVDRFKHSEASNAPLFQQQGLRLTESAPNSDIQHEDLLQERRLPNTNTLNSLLNENLSFNFSSIVSSAPSSESQSLFSSLTGPSTQQRSKNSPFDSSIGGIDPHLAMSRMHSKSEESEDRGGKTEKESQTKWCYRDPQGNIQGPFSSSEMSDWYTNGYFTMDLLVRRTTDDKFIKLCDLIQHSPNWMPFQSGPPSAPAHNASTAAGFQFGDRDSGPNMFFANQPPPHQQPPPPRGAPPSMPLMSSMMPSPRFMPQAPQSAPILAQAQGSGAPGGGGGGPGSLGSMLEDLAQSSNSLSKMNLALFGNNKDGGMVPNSSMLNSQQPMQRPIHSMHPHPQGPPLQQPPHPPPSLNSIDNQRRALLTQFIKDERFMQLSSPQQEIVLMEKLAQLNLHGVNMLNNLPPPPGEQFHPMVRPPPPSQPPSQQDLESFQKAKFEQEQLKKLEEQQIAAQQAMLQPQNSPPQGYEMSHYSQHPPQELAGKQVPPSSQQTQSKNPLDFIQSALAKTSISAEPADPMPAWKNIVPGALSLSAVEELQRREAEERYQQQQSDQQELYGEDGEPKMSRQSKQQPQKMDEHKMNTAKSTQVISKSNEVLENNSHPKQPTPPAKPQPPPQPQPLQQMPQLPKKSVWGNPAQATESTVSHAQAVSIAEIQKLQEEKEREEEEMRQRTIQQQMASFIANQSRAPSAAAVAAGAATVPPLKWGSTLPWQEQNSGSSIKTLAEIQAEEAEKLASLRLQQEAEARRRIASNNAMSPLSVIVAKNSGGGSVWNNANAQLFNSNAHKPGGAWDDEDSPPLSTSPSAAASSMSPTSINYKNALSSGKGGKPMDNVVNNKPPGSKPKLVKKIEDSQLSDVTIESFNDLFRFSGAVLERSFENIDVSHFIAIIKDLKTPSEVADFVKNFLGNNSSSLSFVRFFISKKTYLINKMNSKTNDDIMRENIERMEHIVKQGKSNIGSIWDDDDSIVSTSRTTSYTSVTYKSALNQNLSSQQGNKNNSKSDTTASSVKSTNQKSSNAASTVAASSTAAKNQVLQKPKLSEADMKIMTAQVETMDEFHNWCIDVLNTNFDLTIDAETFVNFLKDIDSPFEITEYVQTYLGNNKASRDFSKNFISKRSYLRNKAKQEQYEDMCGPAPAITPSMNKNSSDIANGVVDNNGFVTVSSSSRKKKKGRNNHNNQNQQQSASNE